ncbi:MAG: PrsW family intramembrane metalloprotease [Treponema sp.]|jgi:RsiW-degrading membrane proteinase PrsW (M82 family)|nr:PrsW family intramembrane metalloprotease [Treponema sp.]
MGGIWLLLLLIVISALPVFLVLLWFRLARFPFSRLTCLCALLAGAVSLFPALLLQRFFAGFSWPPGRWDNLVYTFIRIALTEELSRLLVLGAFFFISGKLQKDDDFPPAVDGGGDFARSGGSVAWGAAAGLLAGLGFAMLESAAYSAADFRIPLGRIFTAAPLHGACGARIGSALLVFREQPRRAVFRFFSAVIIHGIYNFMIIKSGFSSLLAVLIVLSALASSVIEIRGGMKH